MRTLKSIDWNLVVLVAGTVTILSVVVMAACGVPSLGW